jgi:hypothetical protein
LAKSSRKAIYRKVFTPAETKSGFNPDGSYFRISATVSEQEFGITPASSLLESGARSSQDPRDRRVGSLLFLPGSGDLTVLRQDSLHSPENSAKYGPKFYDLETGDDKTNLLDHSLVGGGSILLDQVAMSPQSRFATDATRKSGAFHYFQLGTAGAGDRIRYGTGAGIAGRNSIDGIAFFVPQQVPEPGTVGAAGLLGALVVGSGLWRRYRRTKETVAKIATVPASSESALTTLDPQG